MSIQLTGDGPNISLTGSGSSFTLTLTTGSGSGGDGNATTIDGVAVDLDGITAQQVLAYNGSTIVPATLEDNDELLTAFEALLETVLGPEV